MISYSCLLLCSNSPFMLYFSNFWCCMILDAFLLFYMFYKSFSVYWSFTVVCWERIYIFLFDTLRNLATMHFCYKNMYQHIVSLNPAPLTSGADFEPCGTLLQHTHSFAASSLSVSCPWGLFSRKVSYRAPRFCSLSQLFLKACLNHCSAAK